MKPTLPNVIICDIDGTLAHMKNRSPYDWDKVDEDEPDFIIWDILLRYHLMPPRDRPEIILVSGRDDVARDKTLAWLELLDIPYDSLLMRSTKDNRDDTVVKRELYETNIKGKYNVLFVLDDRNKVVKMWRELGLKCLQVADGDF